MTETSTARPAQAARAAEPLFWAGTVFAIAVLLHNFDHVRRGADAVSTDVFLVGTAAIVLEVAVVILCVARHRRGPLLAALSGFALAVGYLVVHFTPRRGWLSDSLIEGGASPLSLAAASLEVVAALALGAAGLVALRGAGAGAAAMGSEASLSRALIHPVAAATILGNAAVIVLSALQR